jgi:hypothetical protein
VDGAAAALTSATAAAAPTSIAVVGIHATTADATVKGVVYSLEIAIGPDLQRPGVAKRFATDLTFSEPVEVFRSQSEFLFKCCNLCSSRAYRVRLVVEYGGVRFSSSFVDFSTLPAPPPPPSVPRLTKKTFPADAPGSISIRVEWRELVHVIPAVTHYECYRRQTFRRLDTSHALSPIQKNNGSLKTRSESSDSLQLALPQGYFDETGEWELNCEGPLNSVRLSSPAPGCVGWEIRVRAQNVNGWSDFSPSLTLNWKNHSALFPAGFYRPSIPESRDSMDTDIESSASAHSEFDNPACGDDYGIAVVNKTSSGSDGVHYGDEEACNYDEEDFEGEGSDLLDRPAESPVREKPSPVPRSPRSVNGGAGDVGIVTRSHAASGGPVGSPRVLATATD